ncbi:TetR/AcrR family transcriptional regulator [Leptospira yasudae]|uniref:TetR/AcrR family transcriptional regulator n=1 Tax=Leptospira yasudae TaxID=2202201 RepID=A0A6N4R1E2_9LEPT|nr:TetR/AcrR family transcriptional regulator [Leptospira yasudae]TGL81457.1 TetR/AcrR family transcriptional regulator [Leptospira yasudae]TGL81700.1 TetR/AcrR family transcriptional regulator [Leptospira yasudae]TGL88076.1 TetR/AcrR family transcriptional regulator [Leptospira yasudae]
MIERILERTTRLFLSAGFAKTNTDEIAKHIGISKRTLYRYYDAKEKLINAVFDFIKDKIRSQHEAIIADKSKSPSQRLREILFIVSELGSKMGKPFARDIQNLRPDLFSMMQEYRRERMRRLADLIREGQEIGEFRKDINRELTIDILVAALDGIINPTYLTQTDHSIASAFESIFNMFLQGIECRNENIPLVDRTQTLPFDPHSGIFLFQVMHFDDYEEKEPDSIAPLLAKENKKKSTWLMNAN